MVGMTRHDEDRSGAAAGPAEAPGAPEARGYPAKRQAIMDAAADVFLREGYPRASVDAIAAAAGVSKQTVYNHFGDKDNLLVTVALAIQDEILEQQQALLDAAFPDFERLRDPDRLRAELVDLTAGWVGLIMSERISALRFLVFAEAEHHPDLFKRWMDNGPRRIQPRLGRLLVRLARAGLLDVSPELAAEPERLAHQLTGAATNEIQNSVTFAKYRGAPENGDTRALIANGVDFFLRAYAPRPT
jgi:TetR/AcrR family transcriptional repressor of mexJK operon